MFPVHRPRRLRRTPALRRLVRETALSPDNFVMPYFVRPGRGGRREIESMPGQFQLSIDELLREAEAAYRLGIPAVLLFGIPSRKDEVGSEAYARNGIIQEAVRRLKKAVPELVVMTDLCFCEYTRHGHCGILKKGGVDNDATLKLV
ncbi:MAG: porphobilinogen synthase, partial [Elusimicrobia bacterium]|nr:porphobilinogen synthase [Elusimicrobiota bacterium]